MEIKTHSQHGFFAYVDTEGTVARYRFTMDGRGGQGPYTFDALVDEAGDEHQIVIVREGESGEGVVTNGNAALGAYEVFADDSATVEGIKIPEGIQLHIIPETVATYVVPRTGRWITALNLTAH